VSNAFKNIVIRTRPDVKAQTIGSSVKDAQAPELVKLARDNVSAAFGIPPSILSGENSDKSNQSADYAAFYQFCVTPLMVHLCETVNEQFLDRIGLELWPDPARLPVNGQAFLEKATALVALTGAPVLTVDEAREMLDLEAIEEAGENEVSAPMPPQTAPEAPEEPEMEDDEEVDIEAVKSALKDWRDGAIEYVKSEKPAYKFPIPSGIPFEISGGIFWDLQSALKSGDVRAVFERHWPVKRQQENKSDLAAQVAALTAEIAEARKALGQ
jgi:hypothetical protein